MSSNDPLTIIHGDALSSLRTLESESIQCVVTSPPYWGLRDYGVAPIVWGGTVECSHKWRDASWRDSRKNDETAGPKQRSNTGSVGDRVERPADLCLSCGAWRGCLGLEPTPEMYVSHLVEIFSELKRVLRGNGTLWLNLGDSYAAQGGPQQKQTKWLVDGASATQNGGRSRVVPGGLKSKDLVGIPWMVAFALRADGWYLRSDVIWSKPNPMPESVTDRPTKSHEYIFLLSKSEKYYYDLVSVSEPLAASTVEWGGGKRCWGASDPQHATPQGTHGPSLRGHGRCGENGDRRNRRTVWTVTTKPYPEAHFATFPNEIPRLCVLAGTKTGDVVLDCFAGSGTTCKVAIELGRRAIAIEPKAEYIEMIKRRCQTTIGLPLAI